MGRELYQLVAISKNNLEYIVELNNENKKNKGSLEFIDSGTTRFKDEHHLAEYLYRNGKIPTKDVRFAIKYIHQGNRYLPVIFNDKELASLTRNQEDTDMYGDYVFYLLKRLEVALHDKTFYRFLMETNSRAMKQSYNGNYLNLKLITDINEYFNLYVLNNDIDSNKADIQYSILKELYSYKQLRTIRSIYNEYMALKEKRLQQQEEREMDTPNRFEDMPDIPDDIAHAYRHGGMDEVYSIADLDDLESKGIRLK